MSRRLRPRPAACARAVGAAFAGTCLAVPVALSQEVATVQVATHYSAEQAAPLLACFARYEEETGTAVEHVQLSYRDYLQTVLTSRLAGRSPDVYHLYSSWGAQLVDNGVLAEPPDEVADFVREAYAETTVEAATIDGTLYGVPSEVSAYMLLSNMRLLREAGIDEPPTTFEGLKDAARKITAKNAQGRIETAGFALADSSTGTGLVHPFYAQLYSAGIDPYEEGFEGTNLGSDAAVAAVTDMKSLFDEGVTDRSVDAFDFPAGGIGMAIMANWFEADVRAGFGDSFEDDVRVTQLPFGEDWKTLQYAFLFGVDSGSDVADEAWGRGALDQLAGIGVRDGRSVLRRRDAGGLRRADREHRRPGGARRAGRVHRAVHRGACRGTRHHAAQRHPGGRDRASHGGCHRHRARRRGAAGAGHARSRRGGVGHPVGILLTRRSDPSDPP